MEKHEKLNMQIQEKDALLEPLRRLNLMDDFLFDVTTRLRKRWWIFCITWKTAILSTYQGIAMNDCCI